LKTLKAESGIFPTVRWSCFNNLSGNFFPCRLRLRPGLPMRHCPDDDADNHANEQRSKNGRIHD
jgi:hypothetical protein